MKAILIQAILFFCYCELTAQTDSLQKTLCGKSKREWVITRWKVSMGNKTNCTDGKSYEFLKDGLVNVVECIGGQKTKTVTEGWMVSDSNQNQIKIGNRKYMVLFETTASKPNIIKMRLRELVYNKITPSQTIDFVYEKD